MSKFDNIVGYIINNGCSIASRIDNFIIKCKEYNERDIKQTEVNKFYYEKMRKDIEDHTLEVDINPVIITQPNKDIVEDVLPGGREPIYPYNATIRFDEKPNGIENVIFVKRRIK